MRRRSTGYAGQQITDDQACAINALHNTISTTVEEHGIAGVPCLGDDRDLWISEDRTEQHIAADRCLDCHCYLACLQYRRAHIEAGAVFAGTLPGRNTE